MTKQQNHIARMAVALLLGAIRRNDKITLGALLEAYDLTHLHSKGDNPLSGVKEEDFIELLRVLEEQATQL